MHPFFMHSLSYNELGSNGAAALAPGLAANGSLTSVSASPNLLAARRLLTSLCCYFAGVTVEPLQQPAVWYLA